MLAPTRSLAAVLVLAFDAAGVAGFSHADLARQNYDDPMEGLWCVGLTASGFEQSAGAGRSGQFYAPQRAAIDYFSSEGANCFRVPITWERLQSTLNSTELDPVDGFLDTVNYITLELKGYAIVVPSEGIGGGLRYQNENVGMDDFINLWTAIANQFASNDHVIFELFDYPLYGCHDGDCGAYTTDGGYGGFFGTAYSSSDSDGRFVRAWLQWCQGAINTIRSQGADNYVLVPGLRKSSCRDWTGAEYWGEQNLEGYDRAGNLALFSLNDTAMRTAYSVHQFFDQYMTGSEPGCTGHDVDGSWELGWSADKGCLEQTVAMAQKYNKKLWLTEVASFTNAAPGSSEWESCDSKMDSFLDRMAGSGVFLGYQVMQFGCETCGNFHEDQWSKKPYNLDWYNFEKYGITTTVTTSTSTTSTLTTSTSSTTTATSTTSTVTTSTSTTSTVTTSTSTATIAPVPVTDNAMLALPSVGLASAAALLHNVFC
jgi:hypothetical protein